MLQPGGVYPGVKAVEMLRHVAALHAHPLDVPDLVERLGLGSAGRTPYRRLSGGQQQRLSLAMAVVGRPELVFLDEPTAGLDPQARRATWDLVEALRTDGVTVVLTTHFMDEAERLADTSWSSTTARSWRVGSPGELAAAGRRAAACASTGRRDSTSWRWPAHCPLAHPRRGARPGSLRRARHRRHPPARRPSPAGAPTAG